MEREQSIIGDSSPRQLQEFYVQSMVGPLDSKVGRSGEPNLNLAPKKDFYTRWHCLHIDPALRPEKFGSPVNPNERLVISHSATNRRLAVENANWFRTLFGMECEVTLHTYLDVHKREMAENIWMIVTQTCGESKEAVRCMQ
ncbi:hypothetical protein J437_LFUL001542 [Ladona fulva]|uniref:Uncharacterized protein n=1 Tax=Ladona fulva TaxID=123851 RepID=A0A8K0NSP8_LADFU|nr:hypothetical protein J437_LFUL001542 [Ladona fulva]